MRPHTPRVEAVHDMSCFGRCSLTVIIPTLSCMGIQVCPLPTAILSTHLGGFKDVAFADFTNQMTSFSKHWRQEHLSFDCIYSGFLASEQQIDIVSQFVDEFSHNRPLVLVDPVMGDEGRLYSVYTSKMQDQMRRLLQKADIITPNYTEACFLLGKPYEKAVADPIVIKDWLAALSDLGPGTVIMTGVPVRGGSLLNIGFERETGHYWEVVSKHIPAHYPGTGDIFASVLAGSLLGRYSLPDAMLKAAQFVEHAIKVTFAAGTPAREGVLLERVLPWLCQTPEEELKRSVLSE